MPTSSLFTRFKRSGSISPSIPDERERRASTASTLSPQPDRPITPSSQSSPSRGSTGSTFIEDFDDGRTASSISPLKARQAVEPLAVPISINTPQHALGTPKLVLTEEGSNSPRSFSSSPLHRDKASSMKRESSSDSVGLGLGAVPDTAPPSTTKQVLPQTLVPADMLSIASAPITSRPRSESVVSGQSGSRSRSGSVATTSKLNGENLRLSDKKSKRERRKSTCSHKSGIAAALAKGGLVIAHPISTGEDIIHKRRVKRHARNGDPSDGDMDSDELEDDGESYLGDDQPVHGFAVASNRRNSEFHAMFPVVDDGDYLIEDYGCALSKDILVQGRLYVSESHICFHANIFGWVTDVTMAFTDIKTMEKKMTALVIPNAIAITTSDTKYTFASFLSRDSTFDVLMNIWRLCNPNAVMSSLSLPEPRSRSRPTSMLEEVKRQDTSSTDKGHAPTQCSCSREGKHLSETALEATFPSSPEKVYNLMFNSEWFRSFLCEDQKLKDIEYSDWRPSIDSKNLVRSTSYIKPLSGSIGPKQTKCHIIDEQLHCDYDDHIIMLTTTRTPDVPSGGVFSVKTRSCFMWTGGNSTKLVVTTQVEWTGKSWVKGIIEKSAVDGQKQYHDDLAKGMRKYIKDNASEFAGSGDQAGSAEVDVEVDKQPTEAEDYAAQTRRARQDRDLSGLQYALDALTLGIMSIFRGLAAAFTAIMDMLRDGPVAKEAVLGLIILLLVLSNIYTYIAYRPSASELRRQHRTGSRDDIAEAVKLLLLDSGVTANLETMSNPRNEVRELEQLLDQVEKRATTLRIFLRSAIGGENLEWKSRVSIPQNCRT